MSKKLVPVIVFCFLFVTGFAQPKKVENTLIQKVNDSTIKVSENAIVPGNQTFFVYDEDGKLEGQFGSGKAITMSNKNKARKKKVLNCAKIKCPDVFRKGTVCWECR